MNHQDKPYNCPFRMPNKPAELGGRRAAGKDGYALMIVMMMATILLVSLAAALPNVYVEGQRERESELIFRGEQYARAIALFHKQFNRYPTSVKELLHTNQMSFLRRAYRDPMSKSGKWRFIHATATGVILDSKIMGSPGQRNTQKGEGGTATGANAPNLGEESPGTPSAQNAPGKQGFSLSGGQQAGTSPGQNGQGNQGNSMFGEENQLIGAYIVGVASTSSKTSIRVFEGRTHYDDWEFLGVPGAPGGPQAAPTGGAPSLQQQVPSTGQTPQSNPGQNAQPTSIFGGSSNPN